MGSSVLHPCDLLSCVPFLDLVVTWGKHVYNQDYDQRIFVASYHLGTGVLVMSAWLRKGSVVRCTETGRVGIVIADTIRGIDCTYARVYWDSGETTLTDCAELEVI